MLSIDQDGRSEVNARPVLIAECMSQVAECMSHVAECMSQVADTKLEPGDKVAENRAAAVPAKEADED